VAAIANLSKTTVAIGVVLASVLATMGPGAVASAKPGTGPVGPHQSFVGLVNDQTKNASIKVLCPGPLRVHQTGHPVAGQTIGIGSMSASAAASGFTGTLADTIVVRLATPAASTASAFPPLTFTAYEDQPLATDILLPCTGQSTVLFAPRPTSPTARGAKVPVVFEATCGGIVCPVTARRQAQ
jgi:hypothetical protein